MKCDRRRCRRAVRAALLLAVAVSLAGCGRKGGLDPPPSSEISSPAPAPAAAGRTYIDPMTPTGGPQEAAPPPVQSAAPAPSTSRKTFLLDPLIR